MSELTQIATLFGAAGVASACVWGLLRNGLATDALALVTNGWRILALTPALAGAVGSRDKGAPMAAMLRRVGLDPLLIPGGESEFGEARQRCVTCEASELCSDWLKLQGETRGPAPAFCPNSKFCKSLRERTPYPGGESRHGTVEQRPALASTSD